MRCAIPLGFKMSVTSNPMHGRIAVARVDVVPSANRAQGANDGVGPHEDAPHHVNNEDCREVDEQKKSGFDLFYLMGIYATVKIGREYTMGDQSGRPLCCVGLPPILGVDASVAQGMGQPS